MEIALHTRAFFLLWRSLLWILRTNKKSAAWLEQMFFYGLGLLIVFLASPKDLKQVPPLSWISEMMLTLSKMYTNKQQWRAKVLHLVRNKNSKHFCECDEISKWAMLQKKKKTSWLYQTHTLSFFWKWDRLVNTSMHWTTCISERIITTEEIPFHLSSGSLLHAMGTETKWAISSTSVKHPGFICSSGTVSIYICHTVFAFSF